MSSKACPNPYCTCTDCGCGASCTCNMPKDVAAATSTPKPAATAAPGVSTKRTSLADLVRALDENGDASDKSASAAALVASKSATGGYLVDTDLVKDQGSESNGGGTSLLQQQREQEKQLLLSNEQIDLIRKERILQLAMGEGITWGLGAAALGAAAVSVLSFTRPSFKALQISTRVSAPAMLGLGLFSLKYEHAVSRLKREADREGLSSADIQRGRVSSMPVHHRVMNAMYDHPFGLILGFGVPFAGSVLYTQMQLKHITVSQRVMHSRVFAQGGIIAMALTTMAFREWMDRRGRFPEVQTSS